MDEVLTVKEVAAKLKCKPGTIYQLFATGKLRGFRLGENGSIRIYSSALIELAEKHANVTTKATRAKRSPQEKIPGLLITLPD